MIDPAALQMVLCVLTSWLERRKREAIAPGLDNRLIAGTPPRGWADSSTITRVQRDQWLGLEMEHYGPRDLERALAIEPRNAVLKHQLDALKGARPR